MGGFIVIKITAAGVYYNIIDVVTQIDALVVFWYDHLI